MLQTGGCFPPGPGADAAPLQGHQTPPLETRAPDREGLESEALRSFLSPGSETGPCRHQRHVLSVDAALKGDKEVGLRSSHGDRSLKTHQLLLALRGGGGQRGQEAAVRRLVKTGPGRVTWSSQRHKKRD